MSSVNLTSLVEKTDSSWKKSPGKAVWSLTNVTSAANVPPDVRLLLPWIRPPGRS